MPSLIPGYVYDIFISYRQKDNKHDGWVTEFVDNLKGELESTFKEEISVYFDINPHDGLLETHDVDASLKDKLKCLVFIPIISRTYCDPKAFAWEHEFKAFVEQASKDDFGLKIRLASGNVASRVLPIVIYDLDKQDINLCESVLGGVLRGVEFIYKSAGVNRPLRSKEEKPHDNINNTLYRDQVNKVANTIKDVLNSLTMRESSGDETAPEPSIADQAIQGKKTSKKKTGEIRTVSLLNRLRNLAALNLNAWRIIALVFIAVSVAAIWFGVKYTSPPPGRAEIRYDILLSEYVEPEMMLFDRLAVSPDGENLVYVTSEGLNLVQLSNDATSEPVSGTTNATVPFFSPEGKWIGFFNWKEGKLMKVPVDGGNPVIICDVKATVFQANWHENEIIFSDGIIDRASIYRVPDSGGTPELLYPLSDSENVGSIWNPQLLPDKKTLLFTQQREDGEWNIVTWQLGSKERPARLVERGKNGTFLHSGHLAYSFNKHIYICEFNPKSNRIISEPQILTTEPLHENPYGISTGNSQFDLSANGVLIYQDEAQEIPMALNLAWIEESGEITPITNEAGIYLYSSVSSDAKYIATSTALMDDNSLSILIIDTETGNSQLFLEDAFFPVWSSDNNSLLYVSYSTLNQVFQKPRNLSTDPELLFEIDSASSLGISSLSKDGRYLPFMGDFDTNGSDLGYFDMENNQVVLLDYYNTKGNDQYPAISPDGEWLAYTSDFSRDNAVYIAPFPGPGEPARITPGRPSNDITLLSWAPDMKALYYVTTEPEYELWKVEIQASEDNLSFEPAQSILAGTYVAVDLKIHPDGDRFLVFQMEAFDGRESTDHRIKVVVNWEQAL